MIHAAKMRSRSLEQSEHGTRGGGNDFTSFNHSPDGRCRMGGIWADKEAEQMGVDMSVLDSADGEKLG